MNQPIVSIIIRTHNEEDHIETLIHAINEQDFADPVEIVVVDSESTDKTVEKASAFTNVRIVTIPKKLFSYGYALNKGLQNAGGTIAVSISAHCVPTNKHWLSYLVAPLTDQAVAISYGRQIGTLTSRLSEKRIFDKTFPRHLNGSEMTIYNHNGNSAFRMDAWRDCPFDETLHGLEDLEFALKTAKKGWRCVYAPEATVFHYHLETNDKVFNRYYRETLALKQISQRQPVSTGALLVDLGKALLGDYVVACKEWRFRKVFLGVLGYRLSQYFAIYMAYHESSAHRITYYFQNYLLQKISHGHSGVIRLRQDGVLRRVS